MAEAAAKNTDQGQRTVRITRDELPLSCPRPDQEAWNMHPKVYLPIEKTGEEVCPYCGAHYILEK